jgi:hypothetical protein
MKVIKNEQTLVMMHQNRKQNKLYITKGSEIICLSFMVLG